MALTIDAPVVTTTPSSTTSHPLNLPTYTAGDVWLLIVLLPSPATLQAEPSGWVMVDLEKAGTTSSGPALRVYYREPDGTEGSTLSITLTAGFRSASHCYSVSGTNLGTPFAGTGTNTTLSGGGFARNGGTVAGTDLPNAGFTTTVDETVVFQALGVIYDGAGTLTSATGFGSQTDTYLNNTTSDLHLATCYKAFASAGSTGALDATSSGTGRWVNIAVGLSPAATAITAVRNLAIGNSWVPRPHRSAQDDLWT